MNEAKKKEIERILNDEKNLKILMTKRTMEEVESFFKEHNLEFTSDEINEIVQKSEELKELAQKKDLTEKELDEAVGGIGGVGDIFGAIGKVGEDSSKLIDKISDNKGVKVAGAAIALLALPFTVVAITAGTKKSVETIYDFIKTTANKKR